MLTYKMETQEHHEISPGLKEKLIKYAPWIIGGIVIVALLWYAVNNANQNAGTSGSSGGSTVGTDGSTTSGSSLSDQETLAAYTESLQEKLLGAQTTSSIDLINAQTAATNAITNNNASASIGINNASTANQIAVGNANSGNIIQQAIAAAQNAIAVATNSSNNTIAQQDDASQNTIAQQGSAVTNAIAYVQAQAKAASDQFQSSLNSIVNAQAQSNQNTINLTTGLNNANQSAIENAFTYLFGGPSTTETPAKQFEVATKKDSGLTSGQFTTFFTDLTSPITNESTTSAGQTSATSQTQPSSIFGNIALPGIQAPQLTL